MTPRSKSPVHALSIALVAIGLVIRATPSAGQEHYQTTIVPQVEHSSSITSISYSGDGRLLLTAGYDGTARMWQVETGFLLSAIAAHPQPIYAAVLSRDGRLIVTGSHDRTAKVWQTATGKLLRSFLHPGSTSLVQAVAISPDNTRIYTGTLDGVIREFDVTSGALARTSKAHGDIKTLAISGDGRTLISGGDDKTAILWDARTGKRAHSLAGHSEGVVAAALSDSGNIAATGSVDRSVKLWNVKTGRLMHTLSGPPGEPAPPNYNAKSWRRMLSMALSLDGRRVMSGYLDSAFAIWDTASGDALRTTLVADSERAYALAFAPDGESFAIGGGIRTKIVDTVSGTDKMRFAGATRLGARAEFSDDGRYVVMRASGAMSVWDLGSGRQVRADAIKNEADAVSNYVLWRTRLAHGPVAPHPQGDEPTAGIAKISAEGVGRQFAALSTSLDDRRLVTVEHAFKMENRPRKVWIWDTATSKLVRKFDIASPGMRFHESAYAALSPEGNLLLAGVTTTLKVYDVATGRESRRLSGITGSMTSLAISRDGTTAIAGATDGSIKYWNLRTGASLPGFLGHTDRVSAAVFSADGDYIVSGSADRTVRIWDAHSGKLRRILTGHASVVDHIAVSPDSDRLLSSSSDGVTILWQMSTGRRLASFALGRDGEWLAMTPEGFFSSAHHDPHMLGIVRGLEATSIQQVHQSLYNPDLVREALAGDPNGEVAEAAKVVSLDRVLDSGPAPSVEFVSTGQRTDSDGLASLSVRITDRGKGVGRVEWRVNGVTAAVVPKVEDAGPVHIIEKKLALDVGDNVIEVVAYNRQNLLASRPAKTTIPYSAPAEAASRDLHILAIGINAYVDKGGTAPGDTRISRFPPLGLAVGDAQVLGTEMAKAGKALYRSVHVRTVLDKEATAANLDAIVRQMATKIHARDTFVFFAAAHGYSLDGRFFLIPQDYQGGPNPQALAERAIDQLQLQDWIANQIKARNVLILLDTCESGALTGGHTRSRFDGPASDSAIGRLHEATGRPVLTAAAVKQDALEFGDLGHGVFTSALIDALYHGDINGDGELTVSELASHVQDLVPKLIKDPKVRAAVAGRGLVGGTQSARFGSRGEDFTLVRRLQ